MNVATVKPILSQRLPLAAALALTIAAVAFAVGGLWTDAGAFGSVAGPRLSQ